MSLTGLLSLAALATARTLRGTAPISKGVPAERQRGLPQTPFIRNSRQLLQDAEFVYGPALRGFDTARFLARRGGALATYSEVAGGQLLTAAQIVDRVAIEHSLSSRLLLALLEQGSGVVDGPGKRTPEPVGANGAPGGAFLPLGPGQPQAGLEAGLRWAASWLDDGYYGWRYRSERTVTFATGQAAAQVEGPAAHFAVARFLALTSTPASWPGRLAEFAAVYERLFGPAPTLPPPLGDGPAQPPLLLPWPEGERWYFTGGPHGAWGAATAWGAVDFAPPSQAGCRAAEWVVAAAPGRVVHAADGLVLVDLDDGFVGTGWVLAYLHIGTAGRVAAGGWLAAGDRIGHPSCEGGRASGAHVHFARRYNGEWLPAAGGPAPMVLSGWSFTGGEREYDGTMVRPGQTARVAVASHRPGPSDVISDNGPARWSAFSTAWTTSAGETAVGPVATLPATPATTAGPAIQVAGADSVETALNLAGGGDSTATLTVRLLLEGRRDHATPLILAVWRDGEPPTVLMGRTDATGRSRPILLPPLPDGEYTVILRVPGYRPRQVFGVPLGRHSLSLDLTGGGLTPLQAGELTNDDVG